MGNLSFTERLKDFIASIGWKLFLWGNSFTQEEYWKQIYEQEKGFNAGSKKSEDLHGHIWNDKAEPELDDEGDYASYAKCSACGAVENTNESIQDCVAQRGR